MTEPGEDARPVMRARAGLHGYGAGWQAGDQLDELPAVHRGALQFGPARFADPVDGEHVLGQIDANVDNAHGLLLPSERR